MRLDLTDAAGGGPVDGLTVSVQPWMPAHGHGTSIVPSVMPMGSGAYEIDDVYLYMAGTWQVRIAFSGTESDTAVPSFDIP